MISAAGCGWRDVDGGHQEERTEWHRDGSYSTVLSDKTGMRNAGQRVSLER